MKAAIFVKDVYLRVLTVSLLSLVLPVSVQLLMPAETILRFFIVCLVSFASTSAVIYCIGLNLRERALVVELVNRKLLHRN